MCKVAIGFGFPFPFHWLIDWHEIFKQGTKHSNCYRVITFNSHLKTALLSRGGGGGYSIYPWVGRCGAAPHTLTLFKTNIADFPTHFKTEFRFLIPCLRHLTQFKTKIGKSIP